MLLVGDQELGDQLEELADAHYLLNAAVIWYWAQVPR
jgi:hypothetical protein